MNKPSTTLTLDQIQAAIKRKGKREEKRKAREVELKEKYPFIERVRASTEEELLKLSKHHVADCICVECEETFTVATQDLHHGEKTGTVGMCKACRKEARKGRSRSNRPEDKMSLEELEAELARLTKLTEPKVVKKSA